MSILYHYYVLILSGYTSLTLVSLACNLMCVILHHSLYRFYSTEKKKALDYPDWLSPTCTYRLFLIFNQLLSDQMTTSISGMLLSLHHTMKYVPIYTNSLLEIIRIRNSIMYGLFSRIFLNLVSWNYFCPWCEYACVYVSIPKAINNYWHSRVWYGAFVIG